MMWCILWDGRTFKLLKRVLEFPDGSDPKARFWCLERKWESLGRLLALSPRIVYVGHGGPFEDLDSLSLVL